MQQEPLLRVERLIPEDCEIRTVFELHYEPRTRARLTVLATGPPGRATYFYFEQTDPARLTANVGDVSPLAAPTLRYVLGDPRPLGTATPEDRRRAGRGLRSFERANPDLAGYRGIERFLASVRARLAAAE